MLTAAAALEFNQDGFFGTDTNRIARRAGFAPQTFYRHFIDKTDIFIAVYERWQAQERDAIVSALKDAGGARQRDRAVAQTLIAHHRAWRVFRRSLRLLAVEDDRVRQARAESRRIQVENIMRWEDRPGRAKPHLVAAILTIERLCDAIADDELADLALDEKRWVIIVARVIAGVRRPERS